MWHILATFVLLSASVLSVCSYQSVNQSADTCSCSKDNCPHHPTEVKVKVEDEAEAIHASRITSIVVTLTRLEKKLKKLREKLKVVSEVDLAGKYREIAAAVDNLEDPLCKERQFECGDSRGECVYELFVCDGRKDCSNGYDEDEDVCSIAPALAGITYSGTTRWTSCEVREEHQTNITIVGYRIRKYSSSLIWLKALIESSYRNPDGKQVHVSHTAIGHYKFASRVMVLLGEGAGRSNGAQCHFAKGEHRKADCTLVKVASLEPCAKLKLKLVE